MTKNNVLTIDKLSDDLDQITENMIQTIKDKQANGELVDIKVLQEVRQTYKDKLDFYKFLMKHELDKIKLEAQLPESTKRKKLADVEVREPLSEVK